MVKHHKLAIGGEAVIALVGQTAAIASNVLKMAPIIGHFMRVVSCKVTWAQVGMSIVPPGMSAGSNILNKSFVVELLVLCPFIPVVVGLPGVGVEVHRVSPGPVVKSNGGARLYLHPGKQALTRSRDSGNQ